MIRIWKTAMIAASMALAACDSPLETPGGEPGSNPPGNNEPGGNPGGNPPPAPNPVVGSVSIGGYTLPLTAGDTVQLTVRAWSPAGVELTVPVVWASGDTSLAAVTADGLLVARAGGTAPLSVQVGSYSTGVALPIRDRAPTLESMSPAQVPVGSPGFTLTVRGGNFRPGARLMWWTTPLETVRVSDTELRAEVPAALVARYGAVPLRVVNPLAAHPSEISVFTIERAPAVTVQYELTGLESGGGLPVETRRGTYRDWQSGVEYAEVIRHVTRGTLTLEHRSHEETNWRLAYTERVTDAATGVIVDEVEYHVSGYLTLDPLDGAARFIDGNIPHVFRGRFIGEHAVVLENNLGGGVRAWEYRRQ
jgi:hypothetical protein